MKVFVWERADHVTDNWHTEGGLVVFAETEERARELANAERRASGERSPDRRWEMLETE